MSAAPKPLGFWSAWALTVGTMVGSGIFLLPSVLAPYGLLSFGGWLIAAAGSIALALTFARLATRTTRSGGPYVYAQEAFGDLPGFLIAWGYWVSYVISIPAIAIAFTGYLPVFFPAISAGAQAVAGLALIWVLTLINIKGLREASVVQVLTTVLKLAPLIAVAGLGALAGAPENLPPINPAQAPIVATLATTALLSLWAFTGFEAGALPAAAVRNAERVIPRALVAGMLTVTLVYLGATFAVMLLVPGAELANSSAPFADAARGFGPWGAPAVAAGALIATAGTLNGVIFVCGQMPMAVALDGLAPRAMARIDKGGAPYVALLCSAALGSALLCFNSTRGLIGAFTFLLTMSTVTILTPYLVSALAELRHSLRSSSAWALIALLAAAYSLFAIAGSGLEAIGWGVVLTLLGAPIYYFARVRQRTR